MRGDKRVKDDRIIVFSESMESVEQPKNVLSRTA
jgi:hypothetical protein